MSFVNYPNSCFMQDVCLGADGNMWSCGQDASGNAVISVYVGTVPTTYLLASGSGIAVHGICSDGTDLWVAGNNHVWKVTTGGSSVDYSVGGGAGVAFDGTNIWLTQGFQIEIISLSGTVLTTFNPSGGFFDQMTTIYFDGTYMWVDVGNQTKIYQMNLTPSVVTSTNYGTTAGNSHTFADDGTNIWVSGNVDTIEVPKASPSSFSTHVPPSAPGGGIGFDGTDVYVASSPSGFVYSFAPSTPTVFTSYTLLGAGTTNAIAKDSLGFMWVTDASNGLWSNITPPPSPNQIVMLL